MSTPAHSFARRPQHGGRPSPRLRIDRELLLELAHVLEASPKGLRRWSVMRALRDRRARLGHDIALKFEDEVERLFRAFCVAEPGQAGENGGMATAATPKLFFRPKETAGEVWAVDPDRLAAFIAGESEPV